MKHILLTLQLFALPALAAPSFSALNGRHLSAPAARGAGAEACPSGMLRFEKDGGLYQLTIGAAFHMEWSANASKDSESVPGDCTTTFESQGDETLGRLLTTREKCRQKDFNGTEDESVRLIDGATLEYRRESRRADGKARGGAIVCQLRAR